MWISVWEEADGPRLRKLAKTLGVFRAEALGILNFLWLWCLNNADDAGMVIEADRSDICDIFRPVTAKEPETVMDALEESGWIDIDGAQIFINFWAGWQRERLQMQHKRAKAAERMREKRRAKTEPAEEATAEKEKPVQTKRQKPPEKKQYAEFVRLTEAEYEKLVNEYGVRFTEKLIVTLDNYKGSSGKKYKSDYRAMLTWTVDRVKHDYPGLIQTKAEDRPTEGNPFEEWE